MILKIYSLYLWLKIIPNDNIIILIGINKTNQTIMIIKQIIFISYRIDIYNRTISLGLFMANTFSLFQEIK